MAKIMTNERILFGGVDITDAITPKEQVPAGVSLDDINALLKENSIEISKTEARLNSLLANQRVRYTYPRIDAGFISTPSQVLLPSKRQEVQVPKFPVFKFLRANNFQINYSYCGQEGGGFGEKKYFSRVDFTYRNVSNLTQGNGSYYNILRAYFLQSMGFKNVKPDNYYGSLDCDERMYKLSQSLKNQCIHITLDCLFPKETKEKIKDASKLFGDEDMYITAEAKPKDWFKGFIPEKAMIFGSCDDEFYLVDIFNPIKLSDKIPQARINEKIKKGVWE